jgi:hypothetical protein
MLRPDHLGCELDFNPGVAVFGLVDDDPGLWR